jgi:glycosyltransferase involved in cell wall biosynthesis
MSKSKVEVSVVVAAYNEEALINQSMRRIVDELSTRSEREWELICVNDGSTDRTGSLMEEFAEGKAQVSIVHHRRNFGQGRALRTAFDICRGEVVVTLDADLSYGPEYIYRLTDVLIKDNVDIALASPYTKGGKVNNVPLHRRFLSRWGNRYLTKMSNYDISTSTCVVRAYRREVLDSLHLASDGMELQLEVLMKAGMLGYKVSEMPAELLWSDNKLTESSKRRLSKMKILRTMGLYLLLGWLARPAYFFLLVSILLILPGVYMMMFLGYRTVLTIYGLLDQGLVIAISKGLAEVFSIYTYSFAISSMLLIFGFLLMIFGLLFVQNKFYFEELYRISQNIERANYRTRRINNDQRKEE